MPEKCPRCGSRSLQPPPEVGGMYVCSYCGLRTYSRFADEEQQDKKIGIENVGRIATLQRIPKLGSHGGKVSLAGILIMIIGLAVYLIIPFDPLMIAILLFVLTAASFIVGSPVTGLVLLVLFGLAFVQTSFGQSVLAQIGINPFNFTSPFK